MIANKHALIITVGQLGQRACIESAESVKVTECKIVH